MKVGICKCSTNLNLILDDDIINIDDFEGHVFCQQCHRLYYVRILDKVIRLGRCFKILRSKI